MNGESGATFVSLRRARQMAWANVLAGFVIWCLLVVGPGVIMPILYGPISDDMDWTRGEVVMFSSIKFAVGAMMCLLAGYAFDIIGLKRMLVLAGAAGGCGVMLAGASHSLMIFYLSGALVGASALTTVVGVKVLISRWFSARFGFALGLALFGGALAGLVLPVLTTKLMEQLGWRVTGGVLGAVMLVGAIVGVALLVRETPRQFGWAGVDIDPASIASTPSEAVGRLSPGPEFHEVRSKYLFWLVLTLCFLIGGIDHAIHEHTPLFLARDAALGDYGAAVGFSTIVIIGGIGKVGFGWLFDMTSMRGIAFCWLLTAATLVAAFLVAGPISLLVFTILRGVSHGGILVDLPVLAKHCFGVRSVTKTIAFLSAASTLGGSVISGLVGFAHDRTGGYGAAFLVMAGVATISAFLVWRIRPDYWAVRYGKQMQASSRPVEPMG